VPDRRNRAGAGGLIDALGRRADIAFTDHDAVCDARRVLNDDIEPAARRVFGVQAGASWVATLWQETARRAARLLLRSERSEDHAAPLWLILAGIAQSMN
jgi:hypothetical protein